MAGKIKKGKSKSKGRSKPDGSVTAFIGQAARNARTVLSRQLLDVGLYAGQDGVMLALDRQDGLTPSAIAQALSVKAPTITKTISRLSAQGFVRRQDSPHDGRMSQVFITDAGRDQIKAIRKAQKRTEKAALSGLKDKEIRQLLKMLALVDANLTRVLSPDAPPEALEDGVEGTAPDILEALEGAVPEITPEPN